LEQSIIASVENLQRVFAIVLALALGEGFKQVVSDKVQRPGDSFVYWERILGLISFLLLIVPFFQGMHRYYYTVYMAPTHPRPYAIFLSFDVFIFLIDAALFFVMSRALGREQWRHFYFTVLLVLVVDSGWGVVVRLFHSNVVIWWLVLNASTIPIFTLWLYCFRDPKSICGVRLCFLTMVFRTMIDYYIMWDFYYPRGSYKVSKSFLGR